MFHDSSKGILRQLAIKNIFAFTHYPAAVFSHKGNFISNFREEREQLIILIPAGDHKANALCFHLLILSHKPLTVIGFLIA
ncbi:Uncharacterised protein [Shigella sonnei]|nr:Uncharacterised protein [Shigella sonnei]CSP51393.1 Uncharacterised protein [Shigella sonnei]